MIKINNRNILISSLLAVCFSVQANSSETVIVEPELVPLLTKAIEQYQYDVVIEPENDVQQAMLAGQARIAISSRKWTDEEVGRFYEKYAQNPVMLYFTADVAAILVNPDNPVKAVSMSDLRTIFGCHENEQFVRWQGSTEVGDYVQPFAVEGELASHKNFTKLVECQPGTYSTTHYLADREALDDKLDDEPNALAYTVQVDPDQAEHALEIITDEGESYSIDKETILSGRYPLSNVYYLYLTPKSAQVDNDKPVLPFIELVTQEQDSELFQGSGFMSLPATAIVRNRVELKLQTPIVEGGYK
ncbi:PstS family phosphate ABC transporter substrate-binding protein [Vibrio agarivorans]|uniref:Substrate-binding domain-containing protein n=1 Tax=Vibrio agarivorans TaxID=153622 RepID=A0ABT7Y516_9VIBR|nr:substrate-binding domain-containing protein [Vibrio agarivorans]MDN2483147.1 substrate-binding domain-containing protein [Vibrio agarivorans]